MKRHYGRFLMDGEIDPLAFRDIKNSEISLNAKKEQILCGKVGSKSLKKSFLSRRLKVKILKFTRKTLCKIF